MIEYNGWKEFYDIEPWGLAVQDMMQANVAGSIVNMNRDSKKHPKPFPIYYFMMFDRDDDGAAAAGPVLLEDDDSQTELLISTMFAGMKVVRAEAPPK